MNEPRARRSGIRSWVGPELVAVALVVVIYGTVFVVGVPSVSGIGGAARTDPSSTVAPSVLPSRPPANPLRPDALALIDINERLLEHRAALQDLLGARTIRGSELARVIREVNRSVSIGIEHAARLATLDEAGDVGARLELIYASAETAALQALDASIATVAPYQAAAEEIVDLFTDLPAIDEELLALSAIAPEASSASPGTPSGSPASVAPTPSPSLAASPTASAGPSPGASAAPSPVGSPVVVASDAPTEQLDDHGFETGLGRWTLVTGTPSASVEVGSGAPLATVGAASLQLQTSVSDPDGFGVRLGQGVALRAMERYVGRLAIRASSERMVRLRVIGPHGESHGVATVEAGPVTSVATVSFQALIDDPQAMFWIELPGPWTGTVWLDEASFATD
jgi:hypothetical protein